jgi:hypothetical protein
MHPASQPKRSGSHLPTKRDDESERRRENHATFKQVFSWSEDRAIGAYFPSGYRVLASL